MSSNICYFLTMELLKEIFNNFVPQEDPACGWCDDGSNRGTGVCLPGGYSGPMTNVSLFQSEYQCPPQQWFFTSCPPCQCNGHSTCLEGTQLCKQPCLHLTEGKQKLNLASLNGNIFNL